MFKLKSSGNGYIRGTCKRGKLFMKHPSIYRSVLTFLVTVALMASIGFHLTACSGITSSTSSSGSSSTATGVISGSAK
jgi:hypothetical protein